MSNIKFIVKNFIRENFILSLILSKLSSVGSYLFDGIFCKIQKYDTYWLHTCSFGVIPYWHIVFRPEEKFNESNLVFFSKYIPKTNDIVLELGAGIGNETLVISKLVGPKGKIISLEPHPKVFDYLLKTISFNKLKNVHPEQKVLSYKKDKLFFSDLDQDWIKNKISLNGKIEISPITIDDIIFKYNIDRINFLKCNIEGSEIELLNIGIDNLDKIENICIECHDFLSLNNKNLNTFEPLISFLKKNGFKIYQDYKKSKKYLHKNFYIYASKDASIENNDYFSLRDKNNYVAFNRILTKKIEQN